MSAAGAAETRLIEEPRPLTGLIRRTSLWKTLRDARSEGLVRSLRRRWLWTRILSTPPTITDDVVPGAPLEVHILTYRRDYLAAIWALKSFYEYAGVQIPLVIHLEGKLSSIAMSRLISHFPHARIVSQQEADVEVEKWLAERNCRRLLNMRRTNHMLMKFVDFVVMSNAVNLLTIDSDILFFSEPGELIAASSEPLSRSYFQHDTASSYAISEAEAAQYFGINLAPRLNAGLRLFARERADLKRCDQYLSNAKVATETGLIDQTLHALCASERGEVAYLSDSYLLSLDADCSLEGVVARHYAGSSRELLTKQGIPALIANGLIQRLKTRNPSHSSAS